MLLWQKRDTALLAYFINQITDAAERDRAWQRYHQIVDFAESRGCRHRQVCLHFGETPKWTSCDSCDVCSGMPESLASVDLTTVHVGAGALTCPPDKGVRGYKRSDSTKVSESEVDPDLREYLREWRRGISREHDVPAFVVMHDTSLDELCRKQPKTIPELLNVSGFGVKKAEMYGLKIIEALERFHGGARASVRLEKEKMSRPAEETIRLLAQGKSLQEIARLRDRQLASVTSMVADLIEQGRLDFQPNWLDESKRTKIEEVCAQLGMERLRPLKDALPEDVTFEEIRLVVAHLRRAQAEKAAAQTVA